MKTKERTESEAELMLKSESVSRAETGAGMVTIAESKIKTSNVMNPFVDWGFKHLFGTERSKKNLLGFLNLLLNLEHKIVDLKYLNNESIPLDSEGRECIFDILCTDTNNDQYLIEIQNAKLGYIRNRMIYYACRLIDKMGESGDGWNYNIKKVYSICLMNFTYEEQPVLRRDFLLCEPETLNILSDKLNFIMLQLPCLNVENIQDCNKLYEILLYLLLQMKDNMKTIEELKAEVYAHGLTDEIREMFLGVLEDANVASLSAKDKMVYEERLKRYRDNRACLDYAIEDGIKQGIEIGEAKGRKEGLAEGVAQRNLEIAKSMKSKSIDVAVIAECTGLSVEEIKQL